MVWVLIAKFFTIPTGPVILLNIIMAKIIKNASVLMLMSLSSLATMSKFPKKYLLQNEGSRSY